MVRTSSLATIMVVRTHFPWTSRVVRTHHVAWVVLFDSGTCGMVQTSQGANIDAVFPVNVSALHERMVPVMQRSSYAAVGT
jgi:hypothetical protein